MELHNNIKTFHAKTRKEWRKWLEKNSQTEISVWLIIYHKGSDTKSVYYDDAVEEAICFGWIDSIAHKRNEESYYLFFAKRNPKSNWSKANRDRAKKMISQGLMADQGMKLIRLAQEKGTWEALVNLQNSVIPEDLQEKLDKNKTALNNFLSFPPSSKRIILEWILNAKKTETRQQRIDQTVNLAEKT